MQVIHWVWMKRIIKFCMFQKWRRNEAGEKSSQCKKHIDSCGIRTEAKRKGITCFHMQLRKWNAQYLQLQPWCYYNRLLTVVTRTITVVALAVVVDKSWGGTLLYVLQWWQGNIYTKKAKLLYAPLAQWLARKTSIWSSWGCGFESHVGLSV